jgi:hypothetical protein
MSSNTSKRINFNELIPELIVRLKREHRNFESKLDEADNIINRNNDIASGTRIISNMSKSIIHHAVEEEARLMRVIMHNQVIFEPMLVFVISGEKAFSPNDGAPSTIEMLTTLTLLAVLLPSELVF